jgi:predicted CXXCH cytochrome family protein
MKIPALTLSALLLLSVLFCRAANCETEEDIQIFVPESLTDVSSENAGISGEKREVSMPALSTTGKKVALVGKAAKGLTVEIINNNRPPVAPTFHDVYFHTDVILSLGVNLIEVRWRRGEGQWSSRKVPIFRSSKLEGGITSNYPPYTFHTPDSESRCQQCHQMGLTKAEIDTGMEKSCLRCHKNLTENLFVHGPVSVGICTVCHDPDSTPNKYKVQENDDVLCYGCHTDRKAIDDKKKSLHGPVGAKMCAVCHDPHSSPFEFQLVKSKNEICLLCHQDDANRWNKEKSLHPPFESGNCAGCHDPHSSDNPANLKASRKDICALCHQLPVPGHLHEVGKVPQFPVPDDFPLTDEGKTMCLTCHDPHGAPGASLTRRVGCDACHTK